MEFRSDNVHGISPDILDALSAANKGSTASYGEDEWTQRVEQKFCEVFERDVAVFPVVTGTAANALGLSVITPPHGAVFCHAGSHINCDECGAPEFFTGGAKLIGLTTAHGKFGPQDVETVLETFIRGVHDPKPSAISITQATEIGTVYQLDQISALGEFAHAHGMRLHMDGARFANALVSLGCSAAEMTWKSGVDVLSFGATKNGAMAAEAVVFFDKKLSEDFGYRRMRAGHLVSKSRFLSAQLEAYFVNDLWLKNARHANEMASNLEAIFRRLSSSRLPTPVEANEVFPIVPNDIAQRLSKAGICFSEWPGSGGEDDAPGRDETLLRFVTSYATRQVDLDAVEAACKIMV